MLATSRLVISVCIASALGVAACTSPDLPVEEQTDFFAAPIEGSDAVFALSVSNDELLLYVCGGENTFDRYSRWYAGTPAYGGLPTTLVSADGSIAHVTVSDAGVEGEVVELDGTTLTLDAPRPTEDHPAALYAAMTDGCRTGVVVFTNEDGDAEARGTWCSAEGIYAQVTPILPVTSLSERMTVEFQSASSSIERMTVHRIASSEP